MSRLPRDPFRQGVSKAEANPSKTLSALRSRLAAQTRLMRLSVRAVCRPLPSRGLWRGTRMGGKDAPRVMSCEWAPGVAGTARTPRAPQRRAIDVGSDQGPRLPFSANPL